MSKIDQIYHDLHSKYKKNTISKVEMANELSIGISTISKYLADGHNIPPYIKLGESKNARVLFPLREVAAFLSRTIKVV